MAQRGRAFALLLAAVVAAPFLDVACAQSNTVFVTANVSTYVGPERGEISVGWRLLWRSINYTQALNDKVLACYKTNFMESINVDTNPAFINYTFPLTDGIATTYYSVINSPDESAFMEQIVTYSSATGNDSLAVCANNTNFVVLENPFLIEDGGLGLFANAAQWIIAIVAGALVAILIGGGLYFLIKGRHQKYEYSEYADEKEYESD